MRPRRTHLHSSSSGSFCHLVLSLENRVGSRATRAVGVFTRSLPERLATAQGGVDAELAQTHRQLAPVREAPDGHDQRPAAGVEQPMMAAKRGESRRIRTILPVERKAVRPRLSAYALRASRFRARRRRRLFGLCQLSLCLARPSRPATFLGKHLPPAANPPSWTSTLVPCTPRSSLCVF